MPSQSALFSLEGKNTSLLLAHSGDVPRLVWFGDKIGGNLNAESVALLQDNALPFGTVDEPLGLSLFPQAADGFMGSAALNGHRQSKQFAHQFKISSIDQQNDQIRLNLSDEVAELELQLLLSLPANSDVLCISSSLKNTGSTAFTVDWLASGTLPLASQFVSLMTHHGRWGLENQATMRSIAPGRTDISNWRGRTSHEHMPTVVCGDASMSVDTGDVLFAHLAWSGNFSLRVEQLSDGTQFVQAGVQFYPGEQVLAAGEGMCTPPFMMTRGCGINQCTHRFHDYAREHILPKWTRTPRPIHANSWEALYFNHNSEELFSLVDAAANIGAERFILDDGWFLNRRDDTAGLGDWTIDKTVYPDGLTPLVEKVRSHGMQFGLWFEPEMVNPDSNLYRAHPEWALHVANKTTPLARNQLVLNIANEAVQDYLYEHITKLVNTYSIDYIKWDMNRDLVLPGDGATAQAAVQTTALYKLLQRISTQCPNLEIETCASGGARVDYGVLSHTGRVWTSDNIDPVDRISIQQGFLRFYPPEIMGSHVGHERAHLTARSTNIHTRAIVALQGQYGFELDARKLESDTQSILRFYTELYKQNREWLASALYWALPDSTQSLHCSALVAQDQQQAFFTFITSENLAKTKPGVIRLRGLNPKKHYTLQLASANLEQIKPFNKALPEWCKSGVNVSADALMNIGLPLPVLPPQHALLVSCIQDKNT